MRLLHSGHGYVGCRAAEADLEPIAGRHRSFHGGEHLSLRHLSADHRGHPARRGHLRRRKMKAPLLLDRSFEAEREELRVPISSIRLTMADTELTPYDAGTFGSRTTPDMAAQLRKVSATAREVLIDLAAALWQADRKSLDATGGKIVHSETKQSVGFGELTSGRKLTKTVADNPGTTPAVEWKVAGTPVPKIGGRDFVTGKHKYTPDVQVPGMQHGKVLRPAAFGATLASLDAKPAEAMPGVTVVRDGEFVGVTAPNEHLAAQAIAVIRAEGKTTPQIAPMADRKSTRLNSSHGYISYAVFCLKKKKKSEKL